MQRVGTWHVLAALAGVLLASGWSATVVAAERRESRLPRTGSPRGDEEPARPLPPIPDPDVAHDLQEQFRLPPARPPARPWQGPSRQGPKVLVAYRTAQFDCVTRPCWYHQAAFVLYPIALSEPEGASWKLLRLGIGLEGGGEVTQQPEHGWQRHQHLGALLSLGIQYPWRLTPFLDFVATLGAVHRNVYNKDLFEFAFSLGVEAGVSLFLVGSFHVTGTVGWRRWILDTEPTRIYYDSVTATVGLGF